MSGDIQLIKKRAASIKNIGKITKSLETVSALQLKKTEKRALGASLYISSLQSLLSKLATHDEAKDSPYMKSKGERTLVVFVSTNRGLVGGQNILLSYFFREYVAQHQIENIDIHLFGVKGAPLVTEIGSIVADWSQGDRVANAAVATQQILREYKSGVYRQVYVIYNEFKSMQEIKPMIVQMLPLSKGAISSNSQKEIFEPDFQMVFERVMALYVEHLISHALLQAETSEHAARMLAMKGATDNASTLSTELTRTYNIARQEAVTEEILEGAFHHG